MIKTIKDNYYMVVKILLNQIGMDFFGLVLFIASTTAGQGNNSNTGTIMKIVTSAFSVIFFI